MDHKEILVDTAKAALPVGGGVLISFLKVADQYVTFLTHWCGLIAGICGAMWYACRIFDDLKRRFGSKKSD